MKSQHKKKDKALLKIGVSSCFFYPDPTRFAYPSKTLQYMEKDLTNFLSHHYALPVLLPHVAEEYIDTFMQELNGLVLHGGVDMCPTSYGETHIDKEKWPGDRRRDDYEFMLLRAAFKYGKPVLGICRGLQVLNVFLGGTLYQDLLTQKENSIQHRDAEIYDKFSHDLQIHPGGILHEVYAEKGPYHVNTVHHQGIKKLGRDLWVEATCPDDGQIEAISLGNQSGQQSRQPGQQFALGVQWHPEYTHALGEKVLPAEPLLERFLNECEFIKSISKKY